MSDTNGRYVKVDLTQEECDAVATLCELVPVMLDTVGSSVPNSAKLNLLAKLNGVRFKMSTAAILFDGGVQPNQLNTLALDLAKRN